MSIQHGQDMIAVEWRDALFDSGYWDIDRPRPNTVFTLVSTGFLVDEDETSVIIAFDWEADMTRYRRWLVIPKVNIIRQKRWKLRMAPG